MKADFSGYVTRYDVLCSDGVTIKPGAFAHHDGQTIPVVWQHSHNSPENVLGHTVLEHRNDGVYGRVFLNSSPNAQIVKDLVIHGDVSFFSIWANHLVKKGMDVVHGLIREVSVVLAGANEGAVIDYVSVQHGESPDTEVAEAFIYASGQISLGEDPVVEHSDTKEEDEVADTKTDQKAEPTVKDVLDTLNPEQVKAVEYVISQLIDDEASSDDDENKDDENKDDQEVVKHDDLGGETMTRNVFDQAPDGSNDSKNTLSHDALMNIVAEAKKMGSLKEAFLAHAGTYGIDNIDRLFPDAKALSNTPEMLKRDTSWVGEVMRSVRKSPFARVKSVIADLTADEARAKGYVTGALKVEEVFNLLKRTTSPTTVYKKQKLDRDDILDITDLDVVVWLKSEMRLMLEEEIARAILLGDGRSVIDPDKIKDPEGAVDGVGIRSIYHEHELYATTEIVTGYDDDPDTLVDTIVRARKKWRGTGVPTFFTKIDIVADLLVAKDTLGRRYYATEAELAGAMRVNRIVEVEVMEEYTELIGILVNLADYTLGANKGGEVSFFDDFDIDYNQFKYLYETRLSGALTKPKSAVIFIDGALTTTTSTTSSTSSTTTTTTTEA